MNKYIHIKNNESVFNNGAYCLSYKLDLPEKFSLGKEDYSELNNHWHKAIKNLPIGTIFYKQDFFDYKGYDTKNFPSENFLQRFTKKHFQGKYYLEHQAYLFFILPSNDLLNSNLANPFKKIKKDVFFEFDRKIENFKQSVKDVVASLQNIKLQGGNTINLTPFTEKEVSNYYDLYFNLFNDKYLSDRFFEDDYIKIGKKYAGLVCQLDETKFPETLRVAQKDTQYSDDKSIFFKNYAENFTFDIECTHIYNQICFVDDNKEHLNQLKSRNDDMKKSSKFDKSNERFAKITGKIIDDIIDKGDEIRLIRGHNNIIVVADTLDELDNNINKCTEQFRAIDIKAYVPKGNYLNAIFNYSFPFFAQYFTNRQLYLSSLEIFCTFINNTGNYKSDEKGVLFNSRLFNTPVRVDTWDEEKKYMYARNFGIFAPTGSGKSVIANHLISDYYAQGVKSVIIDLGGSYRKLANLFPNDTAYITYEQGQSLKINPFELNENDISNNKLNSDKLDELVEFIGVHYKRDSVLTDVEITSLRKIIEYYYQNSFSEDYSLPKFILFIKENESILKELEIEEEFFNRKEFLHLMVEFLEGGIFEYLYKETENNFDDLKNKSIIVFELDKVRENKFLLTIMLQLISTIINKVIWEDKKTRGVILFDEVAEQLKWNGVLGRIQFYYQAIRKQNGSVGMILQSINQLPDNPLSKAIIENMQMVYVLGAKNYKPLQERFNMSEHAFYQMQSIKSDFSAKRPFSELFHLREKHHRILRLELPKEVFWAYQTEGAKNEELLEDYKRIGNMEQAIQEFILKQ